ncbi:lambda exonuclease family protein [Camelimonas abortus]|uniref:Lambda exonuclease family protein n=1 Tax=Camelimonas abortus TaxID=1017184 RepID=A0ABV7LH51_9HYPH
MQQGSVEWLNARVGKVTASRVADVIARTKSGYSASRDAYMSQLLVERLTGIPAQQYTSPAMQWGTDTEPQARDAYSFLHNVRVEQVGLIEHPVIGMSAASPDGLVGADGLVEIKCPNTHTHIDTLLSERIPAQYEAQMLWQMACTGRDWCDFVSFDPRVPAELQIFVKRFHRDAERIASIEAEVIKFLAELDDKLSALRARYYRQEAA